MPAYKVRIPAGTIAVKGSVKTQKGDVPIDEVTEEKLPPAEFPLNCPRVGAQCGIKLTANYQSVEVQAWVELPVPGFTKELVQKTHERAFALAEDKAVEKAMGLKEVLKTL